MSGIKNLSNAELLHAYHLAVSLKLEPEFLGILVEEIKRRNINVINKQEANY
ncbi:sporulation histidine kinase inhibitor Sda [Niallia sp. 01092]|uniref:sporulation histidine kinase inhibitor Sda n=1 Tax=unclassified Niallia TaxID=2837522 RepID=UPI003FD36F7B